MRARHGSRAGPWGPVAAVLALLLVGGCTAEGGTGGRLRSVDDTGLPSSPIERGWIIALPAGAAATEEVIGRPGVGESWPHYTAEVDEEAVLDAGGVWQPVGAGGRFDLPVAPARGGLPRGELARVAPVRDGRRCGSTTGAACTRPSARPGSTSLSTEAGCDRSVQTV